MNSAEYLRDILLLYACLTPPMSSVYVLFEGCFFSWHYLKTLGIYSSHNFQKTLISRKPPKDFSFFISYSNLQRHQGQISKLQQSGCWETHLYLKSKYKGFHKISCFCQSTEILCLLASLQDKKLCLQIKTRQSRSRTYKISLCLEGREENSC